VSFEAAVSLLRLPRWTEIVFGAVPLSIAIAAAVSGDSWLPWPVVFVLLAVAVTATVGDEINERVPEIALGVVGLLALLPILLTGGDRLLLAIAALLVFRAGAFGSQLEGIAVLVGATALTVAAALTDPGLSSTAAVCAGMVIAWLAGIASRQIVGVVWQMRETERLLAEEVARDERRKLAREVHDVIAHSMTVTLLHVNGARLALRDEPDAAEQALQRAERVGRASLEDLRRSVRLLSESSDPSLGTSVDLRDDLERLRDSFGGNHIALTVHGDAEAVPPFVGLTVFRIVQESLTNAIRHAPGSEITAVIVAGAERITLRVENTMGEPVIDSSGSQRGLHGMFERAALIGGHLEAGPTKDGWVVSGWVPSDVPPGGVEA
jgi:signal transduction histidine kinase